MSVAPILAAMLALAQAARTDAPTAAQEVARQIDGFLAAHWQSRQVTPAEVCEDVEFLRRVTLDLVGRIPTVAEACQFAADSSPDKRQLAIERLMNSPEFAYHFGNVLEAIIQDDESGRDRAFLKFLWQSVARRTSWDELFRQMVAGPWETEELKPAEAFLRRRVKSLDDLTTDTAKVFFGVNISCAKCHDHPLVEDWKQAHYYGMASFFNRTYETKTKLLGEKPNGTVEFVDTEGQQHTAAVMFLNGQVIAEDKRTLDPRQQELRAALEKEGKYAPPVFSPRRELVEVALAEQKFFSRSITNRLWAYFFSRGLVTPVDQMHSENPPAVPGLLEWLADDLAKHSYDLRRLVAGIVSSRGYQRSSKGSAETAEPELFARAMLRPLSPQQFGASLLLATGEEEYEAGGELERVLQRRDELQNKAGPLVAMFDRAGDEFQSSVTEALFMSNNPAVQKLTEPAGNNLLARLTALGEPGQVVDLAVWAVFSRPVEAEERQLLVEWVRNRPDLRQGCRDLVWALFCSAEFRFNH